MMTETMDQRGCSLTGRSGSRCLWRMCTLAHRMYYILTNEATYARFLKGKLAKWARSANVRGTARPAGVSGTQSSGGMCRTEGTERLSELQLSIYGAEDYLHTTGHRDVVTLELGSD